MRAHFFQHVPFEGFGSIEPWLESQGASVTGTRFFGEYALPPVNDVDLLIVMGGLMSVGREKGVRNLFLVLLASATVSIISLSAQASDPLAGTWELNLATSRYSHGTNG